ncbi:MAG: class I SAM-dependent methyltransferase [Rickettsiales bacterium]|jgi:SAM-dependent methyltransferase|nr:class I SAM-dependent methyltransferase [Rickettsiales bacterium]
MITLLGIFVIAPMFQTKNNKQVKKDWTSYINAQLSGETRPLYKKVINNFFNNIILNKHSQYRAVNFGSGSGEEDIELVNNGWEVLSVDSCLRSYEIIADKTKSSKGKSIFFQGDFVDAELTKEYDLIMSFYSLPFGKKQDLDKLLKKICIHIKPEGIFVANFFGENHEFVKKNSAYGLSKKELSEKLIRNGFKILELENQAYEAKSFSSDGKKINWDVFEVIAKKNKC